MGLNYNHLLIEKITTFKASKINMICNGVPQGHILGPILVVTDNRL